MDDFFAGTTSAWNVLTIFALACISVVSRSMFFLSNKEWPLPQWLHRGLQYAPIAALAAVIVPEIVMTQDGMIDTLKDARLYAAAVGIAYFFWRKGQGQVVLGTIVVGMAVYLPLHVGLGW